MSRQVISIASTLRDGTSQRARRLPALDPRSVPVDERTSGDLLRFVEAYAKELPFYEFDAKAGEVRSEGSWESFVRWVGEGEISVADMVAYLAEPERYAGERAKWLGRPHFALLLAFVELLGQARDHLNGFARRHLDFYYRDILEMAPKSPIPDRANVILSLASGVLEKRIPVGTELRGGKDSEGVERIYLTEREIVVNRAHVTELRSVLVDRSIVGIADVRENRSLTASEALNDMLSLAFGTPAPGDPIPAWEDGTPTDVAFLLGLADGLDFAEASLFLEHHELRELLVLVRQRTGPKADAEWKTIHGFLRVDAPIPVPVHDQVKLQQAIHKHLLRLGLPEGSNEDDLFARRAELAVHLVIETHLGALGEGEAGSAYERFLELMRLKTRIDAEWRQIDKLLARAGRRQRKVLEWTRPSGGPTDFEARFEAALQGRLPSSWPLAVEDVRGYDLLLRRLESHFSMTVERLITLVRFAERIKGEPNSERHDWTEIDRILTEAHAKRSGVSRAERTEVRNIYACEDPKQSKDRSSSLGWKPFGRLPSAQSEEQPSGAMIGWALRSPLLDLREGRRTIILTLGFRQDRFEPKSLIDALDVTLSTEPLPPSRLTPNSHSSGSEELTRGFRRLLNLEVSTADGWLEPKLSDARLMTGPNGYEQLIGRVSDNELKGPGLQLCLEVGDDAGEIAAPAADGEGWPILRVIPRQQWDNEALEWRSSIEVFESLELSAVHLRIEVAELKSLRLQQDDRLIDPKKPFEPFGRQPAVGARLYVDHPEIARGRLERLRFDVEWMGLPEPTLKDHYKNYPGLETSDAFKAKVVMVDHRQELALTDEQPLFPTAGNPRPSEAAHAVEISDVAAAIESRFPGYIYVARSDLEPAEDVRDARRHFFLELSPTDFGHTRYPALAAAKAQELAIVLATRANDAKPETFRVNPPYTPTIKKITAAYGLSIELDPTKNGEDYELLHVHPFGLSPLQGTGFLPRYEEAGSLYIGVRDLTPPQHLTLLFQLAEGTSEPELERSGLAWSVLNGNRFEPLPKGGVVSDTTRDLTSSGIIELSLPVATAGDLLPGDLYWLRVSAPRDRRSVCDMVDVRTQAVSALFDDRDNAADHYIQPLSEGSIARLAIPDPDIDEVEQPYTSFGGRPAEAEEQLDVRVSERLRHKQRAVTAWDYERLVLDRFPEIYKARCIRGRGGSVEVIVIPDVRSRFPQEALLPRAPADLLGEIQNYLSDRASAVAKVRVRNPSYVFVQTRMAVRYQEGVDTAAAQRRLNEALVRFLSPWAFDDGSELVIGGQIYANSILDFIDRQDGVDFAAEIKLFKSSNGEDFDFIPPALDNYHVAADNPNQVLVAAPFHHFDLVVETGIDLGRLTGINDSKIELDFIVS